MTNEELSNKILNDIQYIKDKAELFQKKLIDLKLNENQLNEIRSVLNYFRTADFKFITNINDQKGLLNFENLFSSYKISIEALLNATSTQRLNNFLTNNSKIYEFMGNVIDAMKEQFTPLNQKDEADEREQIKAKIIEDINFLQTNEIGIRTSLRSYFSDIKEFAPVEKALNTVKMNTTKYLDTGSINTLHTFYTNFINRFTIAARAFINNTSSSNIHNELIESAKNFNEFIDQLEMTNSTKNTGVKIGGGGIVVGGVDLGQEIQNIKESISDLQSSDTQIEITKILTQANQLFEKAKTSEQLLNNEIQELKQAKEGHIAYKLSKELQHKSDDLKKEYEKKVGSISWKPWELKGFYGAIAILLLVNLISWGIYFSCNLNIDFWQYMMLKLTINIPLIIYVAFALNEYTKAKKLYEEFDYKRILAQTLMNNYNQFKIDFTDDKDKLLDLIKTPLEKIFDNPVHSIYGDKSGDKNIGLDQLEKITSIIEKMKK